MTTEELAEKWRITRERVQREKAEAVPQPLDIELYGFEEACRRGLLEDMEIRGAPTREDATATRRMPLLP